jgi:hypothetical protein
MPKYFFHVSNAVEHPEKQGIRLLDESVARAQAQLMARNMGLNCQLYICR